MNITTIKPSEACACSADSVILDVRSPREYSEGHIPNAVLRPLPELSPGAVKPLLGDGKRCLVVCKAGTRATNAAQILAAAGVTDLAVIEGGMDAWAAAGLPVKRGSEGVSIQSQTRFIAGFMVFAGVLLGVFVNSNWLYLSGFVGCGLMLAGLTGWCGLSLFLARMPWNRNKPCTCSR